MLEKLMQVAIKVLEKQRIVEAPDITRAKREITILQYLHHPHVVQLYEVRFTRNF
jgi:serine/threonine protein kinase